MEDRRAMYAFFGVLVAFKLFTLILIFVLMTSRSTAIFLLFSHALWIGVGATLVWAPAIFWLRLVRVRAKRRRLQHAEWNVEETEPTLR